MSFDKQSFLPVFQRDEKVYQVLRKHWLIPTVKFIFWLFLLIVFIGSRSFLTSQTDFFSSGQPFAILNIVTDSLVIFTVLGFLIVWVLYYLNVQLITSRRIVDMNQKGIIHHETTELELDNVQDVTTEIKGPLANLFNYGNVYVQTAGTQQNFIFDHVPNPHKVAKTVLFLCNKLPSKKTDQQ